MLFLLFPETLPELRPLAPPHRGLGFQSVLHYFTSYAFADFAKNATPCLEPQSSSSQCVLLSFTEVISHHFSGLIQGPAPPHTPLPPCLHNCVGQRKSPSTGPLPSGHVGCCPSMKRSISHCSGILDYACICACEASHGALVLVTILNQLFQSIQVSAGEWFLLFCSRLDSVDPGVCVLIQKLEAYI